VILLQKILLKSSPPLTSKFPSLNWEAPILSGMGASFTLMKRTTLLIYGKLLPPGINVLLRMHWAVRKKKQEEFRQHIHRQNPHHMRWEYTEPVIIQYTRKSSRYMDWDNAAGSFKLLGDSLVELGILPDDNPLIITELIIKQKKVTRIEQGFEIRIYPASSLS
jgi:hypothetical protein